MKTANCRSCGAAIIWAITETGKRMPVDAEPIRLTVFALAERDLAGKPYDPPFAWRVDPLEGHAPLHVSHFATCPNADEHRRGGYGARS